MKIGEDCPIRQHSALQISLAVGEGEMDEMDNR